MTSILQCEWVQVNPDMLAIARLYLERYCDLQQEDRILFRKLIIMFSMTSVSVGPLEPPA
jgi:hypothetical protein